MNTQPTYTYADGSANLYILTPTTLEYDPVTPEESSTGMYSGGEPKTVTITGEQFASIKALLESAIKNPSVHIKDRTKTSGAISVKQGTNEKKFIIAPGCAEQIAIETLVKSVISN